MNAYGSPALHLSSARTDFGSGPKPTIQSSQAAAAPPNIGGSAAALLFGDLNMPESTVVPSVDNPTRLRTASSAPVTDVSSNLAELDPSILRAAELGFVIAPVLTKSRLASAQSYVGALTNEIDVISQAAVRYPHCNWTFNVGASRLIVIEIDTRIGYISLSALCRNSFGRWTKTLQFRDATSRFFIFRSVDRRSRSLARQLQGLKIHTGNAFLLIPPSNFVGSGGLAYVDPDAGIVDAPDWLLESEADSGEGKKIPNPLMAA
jgi:hypothetical protein